MAQKLDEITAPILLALSATLRLCVTGFCAPRDHLAASIGGRRSRAGDGAGSPAQGRFHDGNQQGGATHKKMLKMQVDPIMLLKAKDRKTGNLALASMLVKTSGLRVLPVCS
jgi:hypothetical protein